jgi:hypothetical protein
MNPREVVELRLRPAIRECERHLARLHYAAEQGKGLFPLDAEAYNALSDSDIAILDQMLFRFGRLQDAIGQRLLPAILRAGQDWRDDDTFLDKLNRLEKLGVIPSASDWVQLRDLRNHAMHEYPDDPEVNAANLNKVFDGIAKLERNLLQARRFADAHFSEAY